MTPLTDWHREMAEKIAQAHPLETPKLRPYEIRIGKRGVPRLSFGCMAMSSAQAFMQHMDKATEGERVEIIAVGVEPFPVKSSRHQLAEAQLRESADLSQVAREAGL